MLEHHLKIALRGLQLARLPLRLRKIKPDPDIGWSDLDCLLQIRNRF